MRPWIAALLVASALSCSPAPASPDELFEEGTSLLLEGRLETMRGKPVVINYWATWCKPCKAEMPRIVAAAKRYGDRVGFLGVNVEDDVDAAAEFAKRNGMTFPSISDPNGSIRRAEKILGLPVTQFYTSDGELAFNHQGEIKSDDLERKIEEILRASG